MTSHKRVVRKNEWLAGVMLIMGLIVTAAAAVYTETGAESDARKGFDFACTQTRNRIEGRMNAHAQILIGVSTLFVASDEVTRERWNLSIRRLNIEKNFPGIQGFGFSPVIPRDQLEQHVQEIRSQGYPDYQVWPEGDRDRYAPVVWLEPFSGRNLRAFGYDPFSEPVRRSAMEHARDEDEPVLSGKITLVQETDRDVQSGTVMFAPVYRKGMPVDTVADRRAALYGWVSSPYRMKDLMKGILGGWDSGEGKRIRLQIFDDGQESADSLLYDSLPQKKPDASDASQLALQIPVTIYEHTWHLKFSQMNGQPAYVTVYGVLSGGAVISLLLYWLAISLLNTRSRAQQMAGRLTEDIREIQEKYTIIFNNEIYAIILFDLETYRLIDANDACIRLYGYSREELLSGMTAHDLTAEPEASDMSIRQGIRNGTAFVPLRYHRKKDGTVFPVEIVSGHYTWNGKNILVAHIHDITDRITAEESLHKIMREQQVILDTAHIGIALISDRKLIWVNQKTADLVQYSKEEMKGRPTRIFYASKEASEQLGREAYPLLAKGQTYDTEQELIRRDGTAIWIRSTGRAIEPSDLSKGTIWLFEDITERRQIEEQIHELNRNFVAFLENTSDFVYFKDSNGCFRFCSQAMAVITGHANWRDLIGKTDLEIFPEKTAQIYHEQDVSVLLNSRPLLNLTDFYFNKSENIGWASTSKWPIKNDEGQVVGLVGISRDITDQKRLEEELLQANKTLEQRVELEVQKNMEQERMLIHQSRMAAMGEMISNIAHQWRQPLNALGLLLFNFKDAYQYNELNEAFLEKNIATGSRLIQKMSSTINDFRDFFLPDRESRIFSVLEQVREAVDLVESSYENNNIFIHIDAPGDLMLSGFPSEYTQVLLNLLSNAKEAIVKYSSTVSSRVDMVITEQDGQGCVRVRDTGGGIPEDILDRIFDPYFSTKEKGSGIGLFMSKMIIERHMNGSITAKNIEGGAEFRICVPLAEERINPDEC